MAEKYSVHRFTGNGVKTDWEFNFTGGYIARANVKASIRNATNLEVATSFDWIGDNTIRIVPAVPAGLRLTIYRDTPKTLPLVDFVDGAIINEKNLDTNARQAIFVAAEMVDAFGDVTTDSQLAIVTANQALTVANASTATSAAALAAAQSAVNTANASTAVAAAASLKSDNAVATAGAANTKADGAIATANAADTKATSANTKADQALGIANTAAGQSGTAITTAQGANTKADNAVARALDAQGAAANAITVATGANNKADDVRSEFDALAETVEEIAGGDLTNFVRVTQENTFQKTQRFQPDAGPPIEVLTTDGTEGFRLGARGAISFRRAGVWETAVGIINDWNAVYNKPTSFTPAAHTHVVGDVTGLQGALDAKASNSALTSGLAAKLDKTGGTIDGALRIGSGADNININAAGLEMAWSGGPYIDMKRDNALDFEVRIQQVGTGLDISAPSGMRVWGGSQPQGNVVLTGANQGDAVLKSATNLGKVNAGPLRVVDGAVMDAAPLGYSVMTAPGSTTPGGSYGYFFKTGLRDNNAGWSGLWHSHGVQFNRMFIGYSDGIGTTPRWNEVATLTKGDQDQQDFQGVNRFMNGSRPGMEIWHPDGRGLRFGPAGGFSFAEGGVWGTPNPLLNLKNLTLRNQDESFRDITATRGDGSGAIFLGGGSYIFHNPSGEYEFGGNKPVNVNSHFKMSQAWNRILIGGVTQPKITVNAAEPSEKQAGDLWIW